MEASRVPRSLRLLKSPDRAFEQLYRQHAREVYQYALAVLANPADAEDVTQTTFLNAYRAFQRGERPHKPHNWLIAIAHNVCRMRWRQAGSRPREVALEQAAEPAAPENGHADLDEVLAALATLTFNQRAAIVMRELEGRTYQEISEVLGVSVSAVEALLFRARRRLQLNRKTLGVITTVPLPGSLGSFLGAGAGGGGAAAVGGSLIVKAGTVLAVGTAAAGLGLKGVEAVDAPKAPPAQAAARPAQVATTKHTTTANGSSRRAKVKPRSRSAVATAPRAERPRITASAAPTPTALPATVGTAPTAAPVVVKPPAVPTPKPPALPTLPPPPEVKLPPLPPPPPLPPVPQVKLPPLPTAPPLPLLPPVKLPPLPPLPPPNTP